MVCLGSVKNRFSQRAKKNHPLPPKYIFCVFALIEDSCLIDFDPHADTDVCSIKRWAREIDGVPRVLLPVWVGYGVSRWCHPTPDPTAALLQPTAETRHHPTSEVQWLKSLGTEVRENQKCIFFNFLASIHSLSNPV